MKTVKFHVSMELIRQALAIPEDATIIDIRRTEQGAITYEFTVTADELPDAPEGVVPLISPVIHADHSKRPSTWLTFDWNLPKANR